MPVNGLYRPPANINTWHYRGGLQGFGSNANLAYTIDPVTGEQIPVVWGTDQYGNPVLVNPDNQAPWYSSLLSQGIQATSNIFGSGRPSYSPGYNLPYGYTPTATASPNPNSIAAGLGISTQTLWLIGIGAIIFLFGKRR